jgi:hypothetical protein
MTILSPRGTPRSRVPLTILKRGGAIALLLALAGCGRDDPNSLVTGKDGCPPGTPGGSGANGSGSTGTGSVDTSVLEQRVLSYTEALRTASFKLVGNAPTFAQIEGLRSATDQKIAYEALIDTLMEDPRFAQRMIEFWQNTMRAGGTAMLNTAPTFAARVTVEGLPYSMVFTAASNTCPTFDAATGAFTDGECTNGVTPVGVLTDPGLHSHYFGSLALRRNRFFQEVFACHKQPAEYSATPEPKGAGTYTSPWPFDSIAGEANGGRIDFLDYSSSICANCHTTANHRSPLFAVFDANGQFVAPTGTGQDTEFAVTVPVDTVPFAKLSDFLPAGQNTAWKFNQPAATLAELGQAMADDDEVQACAVQRMWNYAMSKGDIVYDVSEVPLTVIQPLIDDFKANQYNLRTTLRAIFVHDDFVRF